MKLPLVPANVNVSAEYPHRGIPAAAFQSGLGAAGIEIARGVEDIGRLYAKKQAENEAAEALSLQIDGQGRLQQHDAMLQQTEMDGNAYLEQSRQASRDVMEDLAARAKNPGTTRHLRKHMADVLLTRDRQALAHAAGLITKAEVAQLTVDLDSIDQQIAGTNYRDTAEINRLKALQTAAIALRASTLGADKAQTMTIAARKRVNEEVAYRHAHADPVDFLANTDRYRGMDGKALDSMVTGAYARIETARRLRSVEEDKIDRKADALAEKQRQVDLTFLSDLAAEKELTPQHVVEARDSGLIVNRTEFDDYMKMATKQNSADSDQALWSSVQADVWGEKPTYTEGRIRTLMVRHSEGGIGLKGDDGRQALAELARKREAAAATGRAVAGESRTIANEQRTRARESYNLAKEEALTSLGITTPFEQLDKKGKKLVTAFMREYNAVVLDKDGNVTKPARQSMLEILPKFEAMQDADARLDFKEQSHIYRESVGAPVPDISDEKFSDWYNQQKIAALALQKDPKTLGLYTLRRDQLLSLWRARQEYVESQARRAETKKKSTGGYAPPPGKP